MNATYPSDVSLLSDEELETLSAELVEAYQSTNDDGDEWWCSHDAEDRYHEMQGEIRRRGWDAMSPQEQQKYKDEVANFAKVALEVLHHNTGLSTGKVNRDFESMFSKGDKIGDGFKIRRPPRFQTGAIL